MSRHLLLWCLLLLVACTNPYERALPGNWQAIEILEADTPLPVAVEVIRFTFTSDATYEYYGTLKYREAGRYRLENQYLYTRDTLQPNSVEKAVEITRLTADTLFLQMQEGEALRTMKLVRKAE